MQYNKTISSVQTWRSRAWHKHWSLFSNIVCCDIEVERLLENYMQEVGITEEQFLEASSVLTANKTVQVRSFPKQPQVIVI